MTEPREIADQADEVVGGLYHWHIHNANIGGGISSSHALVDGDVCVFIDPVRLAAEALAALPQAGRRGADRPLSPALRLALPARARRRSLAAGRRGGRRRGTGPPLRRGRHGARRSRRGPHAGAGMAALLVPACRGAGEFCSVPTSSATRAAACCTSCRPSITRIPPRPGAASSGCSTCRSPSSASITARRCSTIPRLPCGGCSSRRSRGARRQVWRGGQGATNLESEEGEQKRVCRAAIEGPRSLRRRSQPRVRLVIWTRSS